jgi:BirA family transcriptional regulator, biotin operon repressor / biotin---[acetyl-CoA-carboxylase] ligase
MTATDPDRNNARDDPSRRLQLQDITSNFVYRRLGGKLHYYLEIDSTNKQARELAENGALEGEIVIAEQQTRGRGRLGRSWVSPPFLNLYLSIVLRPNLPPVHAAQITLMAAVALADTVARFAPNPPTIKWPNDILLGGKKLAGILTESSITAETVNYVILGIGVNLNFPHALMPEAIRRRATSLMECGGNTVSREAFFGRLIQDLDRCYGILGEAGFDGIASRWEARFNLRGKRVRVEMGNEALTGIAKGIDRGGALIVEGDGGQYHRVIAGDVVPLTD